MAETVTIQEHRLMTVAVELLFVDLRDAGVDFALKVADVRLAFAQGLGA